MRNLFFCICFCVTSLLSGQITPSDVTNPITNFKFELGSNKYFEWHTSAYGSGFGHRIVNADPGGLTLLNFQSRNNTASWTTTMSITSEGRVGIGTTSPQDKLDVLGNIRSSGKFVLTGLGAFDQSSSNINLWSNQNLIFSTNGSTNNRLTIDNTGNVGIGTSNPNSKLHLHDGRFLHVFPNAVTNWLYLLQSNGINSGFWANNGNPALYLRNSSNNLNILLRPDGNSYINGGNVGIGTTNPDSPLHINQSGPTALRFDRASHDSYRVYLGGTQGLYFHNITDDRREFTFRGDGRLGIGTIDFNANNSDSKLLVDGKILCEEVEVVLDVSAPDYVFQKYYTGTSSIKADYTMPTLEEVEAFTKEHHHLPEVPSAKDIEEDGLELKKMTTLLLQKVEELTLYTIEQEKRIKALEAQLAKQE